MKLLFLTNFYPPLGLGGYEQWCQEVSAGLRTHGHDILILTSEYGRVSLPRVDPPWIHRKLHLEMELVSLRNAFDFFFRRKRRERENSIFLRQLVETYQPDIVLIWGMWNIPRSLPTLAEKLMSGRAVYYMGDYWPTLPNQFENYWNAPPRNFLTHLPKTLLKPIAHRVLARETQSGLRLEHVMFASRFIQEEFERMGVIPGHSRVVYGAIDTKPYINANIDSPSNDKLSLLYVGRLTYDKGVHTAIEALGELIWEHGFKNLELTIVGAGDPEYLRRLYQLVEQNNIRSFVNFMGAQPKEAIPALYHQSNVYLFTSIWAEPFGRVIVEAMVSGLAVVGTAVGGAAEILIDEENALIFTPGNPDSLSHQLKRLIDSPSLRRKLAETGRNFARSRFDIQRMTDEIEEYLQTHILTRSQF